MTQDRRLGEALALIPARGGSKGIPRKNVRLVGGKPLIVWSIEQAIATEAITRVVVTTDDAEIASVARSAGADVVNRPVQISGDTASSESALVHALDTLRNDEGYEPELVVFLQATSPLRGRDDIANAINTLLTEQADSLFSASPSHGFMWRREADGVRSLNYDHRNRPRRQDAPEDLVENGSIYVFRPGVLREHNNRLGGRIATYRMGLAESMQIDEPSDIDLLEALMLTKRTKNARAFLSNVELLVLDFDGVLTDNRVLVDQNGVESVLCHRGDGWGLARLRETGLDIVVLSTETNPVVAARCKKLNLPCIQGAADKLPLLVRAAEERGIRRESIAYVGNDVNDLGCMQWVGIPIAVADAHSDILSIAAFVTHAIGGHGAVREICDLIRTSRNTMERKAQGAPVLESTEPNHASF